MASKFSYTPELCTRVLMYLRDYKIVMDMKAVDFNSDLTKQYEFIRKQLVKDEEALIQSFGPPELRTYEDEAASETESKEPTI